MNEDNGWRLYQPSSNEKKVHPWSARQESPVVGRFFNRSKFFNHGLLETEP